MVKTVDRETYVRENFAPGVADFFLAGDAFAAGPSGDPVAGIWRKMFEELVAAGLMWRSRKGIYRWTDS